MEIRQRFTADDKDLIQSLREIQDIAQNNIQTFERMGDSQSDGAKKARQAFEDQERSLSSLVDEMEKKKKATDDDEKATSDWSQSLEDATDNVNLFGVNLGNVIKNLKAKREQVNRNITGLRGLMGALKGVRAAFISLGIGAVVVALGSLISYFTQTQRGMDKVRQATAGMNAVFSVLVERMAAAGEALIGYGEILRDQIINRLTAIPRLFEAVMKGFDALKNRDLEGLKKAGKDAFDAMQSSITGVKIDEYGKTLNKLGDVATGVGKAFQGMGAQIRESVASAVELEQREQALRKMRRELTVDTARLNKEIRQLREESREEGKTLEERIALVEKASAKEGEIADMRRKYLQEELEIMKGRIAIGETLDEDLQRQAELEAELENVEMQRSQRNRRLITEIKSLRSGAASEAAKIHENTMRQMEEEAKRAEELSRAYMDVVESIEQKLQRQKLDLLDGRERLAEQRRMALEEIDLLEQRAKAAALAAGEEFNLAEQFNKLRENTNEIFKRQAQELHDKENPIIEALTPRLDDHGKNRLKQSVKDMGEYWKKVARDNEDQFTDIREQLYIWLGITPEDQDAIKQGAQMAIDGIVSSYEAGIQREMDANQRLRDSLKLQTDIIRDELDHQRRLQEQGRTNNVEGKEKELQALIEAEEKALQRQERLEERRHRMELANNLAMQISNMQTGATALIAQIAKGGIVGVIAGAAALGQLFGLYNTAKQLASSMGSRRMFRGGNIGGLRGSGWVAKGGRSDIPGRGRGHMVEGSNLILGGNEWVTNEDTARRQHRFLSLMDTGKLDGYNMYEFFKSPPPVEAFNRVVEGRSRKISAMKSRRQDSVLSAALIGRMDTLIGITRGRKDRLPLDTYRDGWVEFHEGGVRVIQK